MTDWILILTLGSSLLSKDAYSGMSPVIVPMQNEQSCLAAMKHDYKGFGDKAVCINTSTGEVKE